MYHAMRRINWMYTAELENAVRTYLSPCMHGVQVYARRK